MVLVFTGKVLNANADDAETHKKVNVHVLIFIVSIYFCLLFRMISATQG